MQKSGGIFYGWWLVLLSVALGGIGGGVSIYIISLIASAIEQEFEASRLVIMMAFTGHNLIAGLLAPRISHLMDHLSVRKVLTGASLMAGAGYLIIAISPSIWGFVGAYALLLPVFSLAMTSLAPAILLSRWFIKHRGSAIGLATLGTQMGGFLFPPFVAILFEVFGWRTSMAGIGVGAAIIVPLLVYLFLVEHPSDKGLNPDGAKTDPDLNRPAPASQAQLDDLVHLSVRTRKFWLLSFALTVLMAVFTAVLSNLALFAMDIGVPRESAALLISLYSMTALLSAVIVGRICDVMDIRIVLAGSLTMACGSMLLFSTGSTFTILAVATGMIAVSGGGFMPLWSSLVGKLFDNRIYARMFGQVSRVTITAAALSPLLSGLLFDVTGGYRLMFLIFAGAAVVALLYTPLLKLHQPKAVVLDGVIGAG